MLERYRLLAGVLAIFAVFGSGAYLGYQYCSGQFAKDTAKDQELLIAGARSQFKADHQADIERARREALAAYRAREARQKGVKDAALKANASCSRDEQSVGLLNAAIDEANGGGVQVGTGGLRNGVSSGSKAEWGIRPGDSSLGVRRD